MSQPDLKNLQVVIPNLHWRFSGVTATNRMVAPRVARLMPAAWLGPDRPDGVDALTFGDLLRLRSRPSDRPVVWHARRNNEMIAGVILKALGWPLKLIFTSAGQRHHTWTTRWLVSRMDALIAASEAAASFLKRPATVILHGIDTDRYAPPEDRAAAFAQAGLPGKYAIGCFGRVRAQKGTDVFVAAMCRLLPHYPDFSAVIVGAADDGEFVKKLQEQARLAGLAERIRFTGELPIDDVPPWFGRILIYAFTSRVEGFGLTLLEAMASGNALVAARAGAADKVVSDGETGVLVPPGDPDALVAALKPLLRDPADAARMGEAARKAAVTHFSVDAEAGRIAAVYRTVLEART